MITHEESIQLLKLPKKIMDNGHKLDIFTYKNLPISDRKQLVSEDGDLIFLLELTQSKKNRFKLSLHFQDDDSSIGLLRVDFSGRHRNPEVITEKVPTIFHQYVGTLIEENHIHYHVEGYRPLDWAIPLTQDTSFLQKTFNSDYEFENVFASFSEKINLITRVNIVMQGALV